MLSGPDTLIVHCPIPTPVAVIGMLRKAFSPCFISTRKSFFSTETAPELEKETETAPSPASILCNSRLNDALSPGARKRGRDKSATSGARTMRSRTPDPTFPFDATTAMSRRPPLNCGRVRGMEAVPLAASSTRPEKSATVSYASTARPWFWRPIASPPDRIRPMRS